MALPAGTVTFLFTDIEGSTRLWEQHLETMRVALARHDALLRHTIEAHQGCIFKTMGDQFCAAFGSATGALIAAVEAQRALIAEAWELTGPLRVRMALHTGAVEARDGDYFGPSVNRVARLLAAGHGGQILLSLAAAEATRPGLPSTVELRDLGERLLRGFLHPERIFQLLHPDLPSAFPPLNTLDLRPTNLPAPTTSFIGREWDVAEVAALLRRPAVRLVTLTGPGGTGKTRLSLQVSMELLDEFESGVFFVPLAPIADPGLVVSAIAQVLAVKEVAGQPLVETLKEYLSSKQLLLVLDNFEQVLDAAPRVTELLSAAPRLKVLVSSREWLNLYGEHEFEVPPLSLPDLTALPPVEKLTAYAAIALFEERARAVRRDFALRKENAAAVATICARLDGLPLAIELAAAGLRLFSPEEMATRLNNRLGLLTGGPRDLPARQQTLRGAIAWSYDLLDDGEKQLFRRLAVFVGGWAREAAEAVCDADRDLEIEVVEGLRSLVDKSLVRREERSEGEPHLGMLETIREYGWEQLEACGEAGALRQHHALYYLALAERAASQLRSPEQQTWSERLEAEHGNLRAALEWSLSEKPLDPEDPEMGQRLVVALFPFWELRGHFAEGREWLTRALGESSREPGAGTSALRAELLNAAATLAWRQADCAAARPLQEESLALFRALEDRLGIAGCLHQLGNIHLIQCDFPAARTYYHEALALRRALGDQPGIGRLLNNLGVIAIEEGDFAAARSLLEERLAVARELGDTRGIAATLLALGNSYLYQQEYPAARALYEESLALSREIGDRAAAGNENDNLGMVARYQGDYEAAWAHHEESLSIRRELGDKRGIAFSLLNLAQVARYQGDREKAHLFRESLALFWEQGNKQAVAESLEGCAWAAAVWGQPERAARLLGAAEALREGIGAPLPPSDRGAHDRDVAAVRAALGEEAFAAAWVASEALSLEEAIRYALDEVTYG